jgi:hypothetical protein
MRRVPREVTTKAVFDGKTKMSCIDGIASNYRGALVQCASIGSPNGQRLNPIRPARKSTAKPAETGEIGRNDLTDAAPQISN